MSTIKVTNLQNASAASPAIVLAADGTATAQLSSINGGPLGARNVIINPNFDIWQRGTSFSNPSPSTYVADRWMVQDVSSAGTISQQSFTAGQTAVPDNPLYFIRLAQTGTGVYRFCQRVEAQFNGALGGQTYTLSFWAKTPSTGSISSIYFSQDSFASGVRTDTQVTPSAITLTTSWTKYVFTGTFPSISGKTLQSSTYASVEFYVASGTQTVDIAQVQLEPGSVATPLERRNYAQELMLCQRYYEFGHVCFMANATGGTAFGYQIPFVVQKRVSPTITYSGIVYSNANSISASRIYNYSFEPYANGTSTGWANFDADYAVSAEL